MSLFIVQYAYFVWSEIGFDFCGLVWTYGIENCFRVWNRVGIWRLGKHIPTQYIGKYLPPPPPHRFPILGKCYTLQDLIPDFRTTSIDFIHYYYIRNFFISGTAELLWKCVCVWWGEGGGGGWGVGGGWLVTQSMCVCVGGWHCS